MSPLFVSYRAPHWTLRAYGSGLSHRFFQSSQEKLTTRETSCMLSGLTKTLYPPSRSTSDHSFSSANRALTTNMGGHLMRASWANTSFQVPSGSSASQITTRSEERRGGKEC